MSRRPRLLAALSGVLLALSFPRFGHGAVAWVALFAPAGFVFGNLAVVKRNFHVVIFAIIFLSILPAMIEILREWRKKKSAEVAVSPSQS